MPFNNSWGNIYILLSIAWYVPHTKSHPALLNTSYHLYAKPFRKFPLLARQSSSTESQARSLNTAASLTWILPNSPSTWRASCLVDSFRKILLLARQSCSPKFQAQSLNTAASLTWTHPNSPITWRSSHLMDWNELHLESRATPGGGDFCVSGCWREELSSLNIARSCCTGYTGTRGSFGGSTELTEVSGTGIEVVPNLPKCRVPILKSGRTHRSVGYRYRAQTEAYRIIR